MTVNTVWHDNNLDPSDYLTTADAGTTYVPYTGATGNVDLGARTLNSGNLSSHTSISAELLTNPNFTGSATGWTLGAAWSYSADAVHKNVDGVTTLSQGPASSLFSVKVEIVVTNMTVGSFNVSISGKIAGTVSTNGTYIFYGTLTSSAAYWGISIIPTNTSRFSIDSISMVEMVGGGVQTGGDISTNGKLYGTSLSVRIPTNLYPANIIGNYVSTDPYIQEYFKLTRHTGSAFMGLQVGKLRILDMALGNQISVSCENNVIQFLDELTSVPADIYLQNGIYIGTTKNAREGQMTATSSTVALGPELRWNSYNSYAVDGYYKIAVSRTPFDCTNLSLGEPLSVGSEKLTNGTFTGSAASWTLGTGWAYSANTVVKNADGTGTLSQAVGSMATQFVVGEVYTLSFTLSAISVGDFTLSAGGVTFRPLSVDNQSAGFKTFTFTAVSNTAVTFTPSNTSRFTIDTVSLKKHTAGNLGVAGTAYLGGASIMDAGNIALATTTGTKIGTATTQKLAFYNSVPIVQPIATTDLGTVLSNLGLRAAGTAYPITTSGATSFTGTIGLGGQVTVSDGINFALNTTTGTKIGTATSQKLGLWNVTPVVQPVLTAYTSDTESVAYTGIDNLQVGSVYATVADLNTLRTAYENLRIAYDDIRAKLRTTGIVN